MENIKHTLKTVLEVLEAKKEEFSGGSPEDLLQKTLSKKELMHIKFNYFKKGILGLSVDSSSWFYHLSLKKEALLAKLGRKSGGSIKDIRFRLGEIK